MGKRNTPKTGAEKAGAPAGLKRDVAALQLVGGHLALDFVNTLDWRGRAMPEEYLVSYGALLDWAQRVGVVEGDTAKSLRRRASEAPARATAWLDKAIALREASYRLFVAHTRHKRPAAKDLGALNAVLRHFPQRSELIDTGGTYAWKQPSVDDPLARPVGQLAQAAAELLTSPDLHRVGICQETDCAWLFLDTSPNRSRCWCTMEICGNRAKARRHYARTRTARS